MGGTHVIVGAFAENLVQLAYTIWNTLMGYCYDTLTQSPFDFGVTRYADPSMSTGYAYEGTAILPEILNKTEPIVLGIATGLLILVWIVGVLREGGQLLSDRAHPYAILTHIIRFFICEGLIAAYLTITEFIFDIFTIATRAVVGLKAFGLTNPADAVDVANRVTDGNVDASAQGKSITQLIADIPPYQVTDVLLVDVIVVIYFVVIIACAVVIFMKVYGRYFRIIAAIALAPIGISMYGSPHTEQNAKKFLFYLLKQGAEGFVIALDLIIFSLVMNGGIDTPKLFSKLISGVTGDPTVNVILGFMVTQIFLCVLLMTIISATEKMTEQLL